MTPSGDLAASVRARLVKLGLVNSRMKDYYDLHVLAQQFEFSGLALADAITATFTRRNTALPPGVPLGLTDAFAADVDKRRQWVGFVERTELTANQLTLEQVVSSIRAFLAPLSTALAHAQRWDRIWKAGGPWG